MEVSTIDSLLKIMQQPHIGNYFADKDCSEYNFFPRAERTYKN